MRLLGVGAVGALVTSCGGGAASSGSSNGSTTGNSSCAVTLEGEEGPYFVDDGASGFNRSNIFSNLDGSNTQSGIPLMLTLIVQDNKNSCATMSNVQVDIWHCNAEGVYSDEGVESTVGETWLRGYQITDSNGMVKFASIFPGWYQGRVTHIHLRLRSSYDDTSSEGSNTTQLFFPQDTINRVNTTISPYSSHGANSTTNANDHVSTGETEGTTLLSLTGDTTSGFAATFKINLPITAA